MNEDKRQFGPITTEKPIIKGDHAQKIIVHLCSSLVNPNFKTLSKRHRCNIERDKALEKQLKVTLTGLSTVFIF